MVHPIGVSLGGHELEIVERGLGDGEYNKSARVRQLIRWGGAVESAMNSAQVPAGRREGLDIELFVKSGVRVMREQGTLHDG